MVASLAIGTIVIARHSLTVTSAPDLYGSARWASQRDMIKAGLLAGWLAHIIRKRRIGIILGAWRGFYLRDCSPGHVLVVAPTRSGKGIGIVIPTLLTWPHSALIHDIKGENWELTAGARKRMGHLCLKFDPTDTTGASVKYNPLQQVRLRTVHEAEDVQNIVHMIIDPDGKGLNDHWVKTGAALLTGTILHLLYAESNKTLRGLAGFLSDPSRKLEETINYMLAKEHDPDGSMGWRDYRGDPTRKHPIVAESMREVLSKSENERSGVFSTVLSFLSLYRDPIAAANTEQSEFKINDLVNHQRPVSLYLVVPMASRDRLRPLMRLILNQIIRTLTTTLDYKDGRAISANRHPLLMMLDEFPTLGHLAVLGEALSLVAGYGIRACLVAQDLAQIYQAYGRNQSVTGNCHTTVAFTPAPNNTETAEELSDMIGDTSVRHVQRTTSTTGKSLSEPETRRPLMTPDEVLRMPTNELLIFTRGCPAIRTQAVQHYRIAALKQRATIPPPLTSDRIITIPPPVVTEHKLRLLKPAAD
ncbi:MAG: type IV secretory system conjugative DNA transfer family protein [Acidobacteria bacterium]|nr:type IV secretory system conjugative DNA transfer family protein [Acidobacteriota bacterium]